MSGIEKKLEWYQHFLTLNQKLQDESLQSVCRYLMDDAIEAAKARAGYFLTIDASEKFRVIHARTSHREDIPKNQYLFSESILKRAVELQSPLIIDDALDHPEFREAKSVISGNLKSILALPIFYNKKLVGLIYLENRDQTQYFSPDLLEFLNVLSSSASILLYLKLNEAPALTLQSGEATLQSKNPRMQKVLEIAELAAKSDSSVLILGETGTGKEVLAQYIHRHSRRSSKLFVPINCSAIPDTLIESELFGYKKGAFTGASQDREGLLQKGHLGTIFLDEIGELGLQMQVKLLRVLQERRFTRLGSTGEEESDFRLISATHQPLEERAECGLFRQDLFFRVNTITLELPPLRDRLEDLADLAQIFVEEISLETKRSVRGIDESARLKLLEFDWPGNIRQLRNAIQRAIALVPADKKGAVLTERDFDFLSVKTSTPHLPTLQDAKDDFIRQYVKKAILIHKGNKSKAARALGIDPKTLYRHLSDDGET